MTEENKRFTFCEAIRKAILKGLEGNKLKIGQSGTWLSIKKAKFERNTLSIFIEENGFADKIEIAVSFGLFDKENIFRLIKGETVGGYETGQIFFSDSF